MYKILHRHFLHERSNQLARLQIIMTQRTSVALHSTCGYKERKKELSRKAMHIYHVLSTGTKDLYRDLSKYMTVYTKRRLYGIDSLSRMELELLHTVPEDFLKVSPCLLISIIPFAGGIVLLLAYLFPQHFLTRHYWTLQQRLEFMSLGHKVRLKHNETLFRYIQAEIVHIKDPSLKLQWSDIIARLDSGTHPTAASIISCSDLFANPPYSLSALTRKHTKELLAIHDMPIWRPFRKQRLMKRGMLIAQMDHAICREGGVVEMSSESLCWALSFRGINPTNMSRKNMKEWLNAWLTVSNTINERTISLLLHAPTLLAYNYRTN